MKKDVLIDEYTNVGLLLVLFEKLTEKSGQSYTNMTWFEKIDMMIVVDQLMKEKVVLPMWNEIHTLISNRLDSDDACAKANDKIKQEFDKGLELLWEEEKVTAIMTRLMTTPR